MTVATGAEPRHDADRSLVGMTKTRREILTLMAGPGHATAKNLLMGTCSMADAKQPQLIHNVYFTLKDGTPENTRGLIAACDKYLSGHPGVVYYAAGPLVPDLARPVNVRDFQVGLCVVFENKQAHDDYQIAPRHLQFIEENKPTWAQVRVFDTYAGV